MIALLDVARQMNPLEAHDPDCPFCRIAGAAEPGVLVVADGPEWVAFFPPEPAARGHTLIIPRRHATDYWELDPDLAATLATAALRIGNAIRSAVDPDGLNLITSASESAEQTVFHVHLHVVPRWKDDHFGKIWPESPTYAADELETTANAVRQSLRTA